MGGGACNADSGGSRNIYNRAVARLARYNYGVPRIALAGGKAKAASTPGGKKERKEEISGAGNEPYSSPRGGGRFNSFNFTDEIILTAYPDFAVRFASYLRRQILSRLSTGVYKEQP